MPVTLAPPLICTPVGDSESCGRSAAPHEGQKRAEARTGLSQVGQAIDPSTGCSVTNGAPHEAQYLALAATVLPHDGHVANG